MSGDGNEEQTCHPRRHSRWMYFWLPMQMHGEMSGFSSVSSSSKHTCQRRKEGQQFCGRDDLALHASAESIICGPAA
jgi:hypothetical protein